MNVYEARHAGREYCNDTEGSEHYKQGDIEPLDIFISKGLAEDFCICNMVKYAIRFKKTRNLADLRKVSDYAQILCGVELDKAKEPYTTYLEEMGEEDVSEPEYLSSGASLGKLAHAMNDEVERLREFEPTKGKYEGLSDLEIECKVSKICTNFIDCCGCPLDFTHKDGSGGCCKYETDHPKEFRKIAIDWLNKQDNKMEEST